MPQIINTNIASLNAQRNLDKSQAAQSTALQRLSSGLRINGAKDDAAGLAISNRLDAQVRGLNVANRNAGDGVSLAQTAEGALNSINSSLQRIRELALQSANGTNTDLERASLQEEVDQLKTEIASVAEKTNFNGRKLLDGSFQNTSFQTGANVGDSIDVSISRVAEDTLGTSFSNGISTSTASNGTQSMVQGDLTINGIAVGAANGSADGSSSGSASRSAIANAAAINAVSDQTGVTAVVNGTSMRGSTVTTVAAAAATITINGSQNITLSGTGVAANLASDLQGIADIINGFQGETGVTASVDLNNLNAGVTLTAADGRNIITTGAAAANYGLATAGTQTGTFTLISNDGSDITVGSNTGNSLENVGIEVGTYSGSNSGLNSGAVSSTALAAGDIVLNGVSIGAAQAEDDQFSTANKDTSAIAVAAAINRSSDATGVTAKAQVTQITSSNISAATAGSVTINGAAISFAAGATGDTSDQVGKIVDAVNAKSGQSGVIAKIVDDNQFELQALDGRNIVIASSTNSGTTNGTTRSSVTLSSAGQINLSTSTGNIANSGFNVGTFGGGESGTLLKDIDISTKAGADAAIKGIDNAINQVAREQAKLGAIQNRFDNTISNNAVNSENLAAANSRIADADFASETAALSRAQVLQQAGISVLAQANARPQQVLSLLQ